jgi:hypothetical protein
MPGDSSGRPLREFPFYAANQRERHATVIGLEMVALRYALKQRQTYVGTLSIFNTPFEIPVRA